MKYFTPIVTVNGMSTLSVMFTELMRGHERPDRPPSTVTDRHPNVSFFTSLMKAQTILKAVVMTSVVEYPTGCIHRRTIELILCNTIAGFHIYTCAYKKCD